MALINCPECGNDISDKAKMCPHCGVNIEDLTFCENCKHLINPTDVKCPNCNTATPWARKCPECGEEVSATDETCPNCGFNLLHHFGKVNITRSSIRTESTTTHQNNYYDELEEDVVRCPDCECELPENWEELRECPQCGCKFERPLSYKLKDNKNNFIIAGVGVLLCILGFITLRDSYDTNHFYLVFNDGEFILSTLLMVVGIIMIICAGFKSSYDFQNAKNISYGISGAVVFGILLTVLVSRGLISQSGLNDIHVAEAMRVAEERRAAERLEAERLEQKRREEKRLEEEAKKWKGASSLSEFKSKLPGTIWGATRKRGDFYLKFKITDNKIIVTAHINSDLGADSQIGEPTVEFIDSWKDLDEKNAFTVTAYQADADKDDWSTIPTMLAFRKGHPDAQWVTINDVIPLTQIIE